MINKMIYYKFYKSDDKANRFPLHIVAEDLEVASELAQLAAEDCFQDYDVNRCSIEYVCDVKVQHKDGIREELSEPFFHEMFKFNLRFLKWMDGKAPMKENEIKGEVYARTAWDDYSIEKYFNLAFVMGFLKFDKFGLLSLNSEKVKEYEERAI